MSVRMKVTHAKTGSRRAHHRATVVGVQGTGASARVRHHVDPSTGMYRGKQILPNPTAPKAAAKGKKGAVKAAGTTKTAKKAAGAKASEAKKA